MTMDFVEWPAGYGHGSSVIGKWIQDSIDTDRLAKRNRQPGIGSRVNRTSKVKLRRVGDTLSEANGIVFYKPMEGVKSQLYPTYTFDSQAFKEKVGELGGSEDLEGFVVYCAPFKWDLTGGSSSAPSGEEQQSLVERRRLRTLGEAAASGESGEAAASVDAKMVAAQKPAGGFMYPKTECVINRAEKAEPPRKDAVSEEEHRQNRKEMMDKFAVVSERLRNASKQLTEILSKRAGESTEEYSKKIQARIAQLHQERGYGKVDAQQASAALAEVAGELQQNRDMANRSSSHGRAGPAE